MESVELWHCSVHGVSVTKGYCRAAGKESESMGEYVPKARLAEVERNLRFERDQAEAMYRRERDGADELAEALEEVLVFHGVAGADHGARAAFAHHREHRERNG